MSEEIKNNETDYEKLEARVEAIVEEIENGRDIDSLTDEELALYEEFIDKSIDRLDNGICDKHNIPFKVTAKGKCFCPKCVIDNLSSGKMENSISKIKMIHQILKLRIQLKAPTKYSISQLCTTYPVALRGHTIESLIEKYDTHPDRFSNKEREFVKYLKECVEMITQLEKYKESSDVQ